MGWFFCFLCICKYLLSITSRSRRGKRRKSLLKWEAYFIILKNICLSSTVIVLWEQEAQHRTTCKRTYHQAYHTTIEEINKATSVKNNIEEINDCILAPRSGVEISMHIRRSIQNTVLGAREWISLFLHIDTFPQIRGLDFFSVVYNNSKCLFLTYSIFFSLKNHHQKAQMMGLYNVLFSLST